ncbi:I78 family peptidase inhibitor [Paracoccus sediminicola]|uniref:I78 family peptidase inhibitor n=1 Tax=Paracoccus sediminicola TaxID=3017783 RepID=UPI0022F0ED32|nr:I78 family peptidase inhibitor [Paracoccus sediminicola]WBU57661.1 I78 family peptidase inhibitor [Paracoccus sediminicola]
MRPLLTLPAAALFMGCTPSLPESELPPRCGPGYETLVGTNVGAVTLPRSLPHRIIQPGATTAEEINPARLNLFVDDKGFIERVSCG